MISLYLFKRKNGVLFMSEMMDKRDQTIVRTSIIGIVTNVTLALFKLLMGLLSHSIAIVLDAVNNLSDAASSLITIIGTKLAGKKADKTHPYGYGRIEYLSAMIIALIVLAAGLSSLKEAIEKVINPAEVSYSTAALIIIVVAVAVKLALGSYFKKVGKAVNSDALVNSGQDASLDAIITFSTLVAALVYIWKGWQLEGWFSIVISLIIIKAGYEMLSGTVSQLLGERASAEIAKSVKDVVNSFEEVLGVYDLVLHDYGPESYQASLHIEVRDTLRAEEIDVLTRNISEAVYKQTGIILTAVGIYSVSTSDEETIMMREKIKTTVLGHPDVIQMHGFALNKEAGSIRFDVVISFECEDREQLYRDIYQEVAQLYPDYQLYIVMDSDIA